MSSFNIIGTLFCIYFSAKAAPTLVSFIDKKSDFGTIISSFVDGAPQNSSNNTLSKLADVFSLENFSLKNILTTTLAFIVLFVALKLCLKIVSKAVTAIIDRLPVANKLNALLGLALGVFKAFVLVFICSCITTVLSYVPILQPTISEQIETSNIYTYVCESSSTIITSIVQAINF